MSTTMSTPTTLDEATTDADAHLTAVNTALSILDMIERLTTSLSNTRHLILRAQASPDLAAAAEALPKLLVDHNKMQRLLLQFQHHLDHILTTTHLGYFPCDYINTAPIYLKPEALAQPLDDVYAKAKLVSPAPPQIAEAIAAAAAGQVATAGAGGAHTTTTTPHGAPVVSGGGGTMMPSLLDVVKSDGSAATTNTIPGLTTTLLPTDTTTTSTASAIPTQLNVVDDVYIADNYHCPGNREEAQYLACINNIALTLPPTGLAPPNTLQFTRNNTLALTASLGDAFIPMMDPVQTAENIKQHIVGSQHEVSPAPATTSTTHDPFTLQHALHYLMAVVRNDANTLHAAGVAEGDMAMTDGASAVAAEETIELLSAFNRTATRLLHDLTQQPPGSGDTGVEVRRGMEQLAALALRGGGSCSGPVGQ